MDSQDMCSEDEFNPAIRSCFCRYPLPFVCTEHLYKHPIDTDFFQHFLLPVYARRRIYSQDVKDQCKPWLFKLHSAYTTLKRNEEDLSRFEEELEAAKQEILHQIETEVNCKCEDAKKKIADLKVLFRAQLEAAITAVSEHALEQWVPEPESLAAFMWNFDINDPQSLKMFRLWVGKLKESQISDYNVYIESSLPSLKDFNQIPEVSENKEKLEAALEECRANLLSSAQTIEELTNERTNLISEIENITNANTKLIEEVKVLKYANSKLAADFDTLQRNTSFEIDTLNATLIKSKSEYSAIILRITDEKASLRAETSAEINRISSELAKANQLIRQNSVEPQHIIIPRIVHSRLICYDITANQVTTTPLPESFWLNSITCVLDTNTALCVGIYNRRRNAYLLSFSTHALTPLEQMGTNRFVPGVIKSGCCVYVFGGEGAGATCEKFSISNRSWTGLPNMSCERDSFTPCCYRKDIYLPKGELEKFDVISDQFTVLQIPMDTLTNLCLGFIYDEVLVVITMDRQIGKWKIESDGGFRVSKIKMENTNSGCCNCTPVRIGREVFWARFNDGALVKFNLDTQRIAENIAPRQ